RVLLFVVLVDIFHAHALGVFGSQLKDISYLNAAVYTDHRFAAFRADAAVTDLCKVMELRFLSKVAGKIQPYIMVISLIGAAGHIFNSLQRLVIQNRHILIQLIRSDKSSYQDAVILDIRRMDMIADKVRDLR